MHVAICLLPAGVVRDDQVSSPNPGTKASSMSTSSCMEVTASFANCNVIAASWSSAQPPMISAGCLSSAVVVELVLAWYVGGVDSSLVRRSCSVVIVACVCLSCWLSAAKSADCCVCVCVMAVSRETCSFMRSAKAFSTCPTLVSMLPIRLSMLLICVRRGCIVDWKISRVSGVPEAGSAGLGHGLLLPGLLSSSTSIGCLAGGGPCCSLVAIVDCEDGVVARVTDLKKAGFVSQRGWCA